MRVLGHDEGEAARKCILPLSLCKTDEICADAFLLTVLCAAYNWYVLCTQGAVARALASLGLEFSEEVVEPVTGYRVDIMILLHCGDGRATGRCAMEVDMHIFRFFMFSHLHQHYGFRIRFHCRDIDHQNRHNHHQ